jgi:glycosyltransferase involved in cell wall biosynthesis
MNKLAVCIIAYNEDKNIASLINKIVREKIGTFTLFVYTDGSTDDTAKIVASYKEKYPSLIKHLKSEKNMGKVFAFNKILREIKKYEIAIFLDADINPQKRSLFNLYKYLISNKNLNAISPLFLAYTKGLRGLEKTIANLYSKARVHAAAFKRYKYLSGRMYCVRTSLLTPISSKSYFDDFYLNLKIHYKSIDICKDAVVYYRRPSSIKDFIKYNLKLGKALASIKVNHKDLWMEQERRISIVDYAIFDLTRYKFGIFFSKLNLHEKSIFIFTRLLSFTSMYLGLLTYRSEAKTWDRIESTKVDYRLTKA